ncbi:MAG: hypothetical protein KC502_01900 [Myxococcales bacterium]|nr:hypothetical protein [Myxococcales bacterium]
MTHRWRTLLGILLTSPLIACAEEPSPAYEPVPMPFHPLADALVHVGDEAITLPLTTATVSGHVAIGDLTACTPELTIRTTGTSDTCALTLTASKQKDSLGLAITGATLVARNQSGVCAPLAARLPNGTADVVYELAGGDAWLPWVEPKELSAVDGVLAVDKVLLALKGTLKLVAGSDALQMRDLSLQLGGDIELTIDDKVTCAPCTSPDCQSPYPTMRLRDAQPKSVAHNLKYSLDRWLGQYLVVILTQGW